MGRPAWSKHGVAHCPRTTTVDQASCTRSYHTCLLIPHAHTTHPAHAHTTRAHRLASLMLIPQGLSCSLMLIPQGHSCSYHKGAQAAYTHAGLTHAHGYSCIHMRIYTLMHMYMYIYTHIYTLIYTHSCIHTGWPHSCSRLTEIDTSLSPEIRVSPSVTLASSPLAPLPRASLCWLMFLWKSIFRPLWRT